LAAQFFFNELLSIDESITPFDGEITQCKFFIQHYRSEEYINLNGEMLHITRKMPILNDFRKRRWKSLIVFSQEGKCLFARKKSFGGQKKNFG